MSDLIQLEDAEMDLVSGGFIQVNLASQSSDQDAKAGGKSEIAQVSVQQIAQSNGSESKVTSANFSFVGVSV